MICNLLVMTGSKRKKERKEKVQQFGLQNSPVQDYMAVYPFVSNNVHSQMNMQIAHFNCSFQGV